MKTSYRAIIVIFLILIMACQNSSTKFESSRSSINLSLRQDLLDSITFHQAKYPNVKIFSLSLANQANESYIILQPIRSTWEEKREVPYSFFTNDSSIYLIYCGMEKIVSQPIFIQKQKTLDSIFNSYNVKVNTGILYHDYPTIFHIENDSVSVSEDYNIWIKYQGIFIDTSRFIPPQSR